MSHRKGLSPPEKRAPRPASAVERGAGCLLGGNDIPNSNKPDQVQFLAARFHLRPALARTVAELARGAA